MKPTDINQMENRLNQVGREINKLELNISVLIFTAVVFATWFSKSPDIEKALRALSWSCFLVAACLFVYWLYDLRQLRRGLREDAQLDHWPIRGGRDMPEWMRRNQINRKKP